MTLIACSCSTILILILPKKMKKRNSSKLYKFSSFIIKFLAAIETKTLKLFLLLSKNYISKIPSYTFLVYFSVSEMFSIQVRL